MSSGRKDVILVTGSPRSGTTPVGAAISLLPRAASLYEPMGSTGDVRFHQRFPMPGADEFGTDDLVRFVDDMRAKRLTLKPQRRAQRSIFRQLATSVLGTRTLASYRLLRLSPHVDTIVWKDPQAAFCATFGDVAGYRTVMTVRPPLAQAASYKRLGWVSNVAGIYDSYRQVFGDDPNCERWIETVGETPYGSGAILWYMVYSPIARLPELPTSLFLLNMQRLSEDESAAYRQVFQWLGRPVPGRLDGILAKRQNSKGPKGKRVHDFNRSAAATNAYWKDVLADDEVGVVNQINGELWDRICALG